jgi:Holliday junction resolvase RusA-like endonuclease
VTPVTFTVVGDPATKGSARAVRDRRTGKARLLASASDKNAREQKAWATAVGWAASMAMRSPMAGPVMVKVLLKLKTADPKRDGAHHAVCGRQDLDKLLRCTLDALTGIAYHDDGQIAQVIAAKRWTTGQPGAEITIEGLS